MMWGESDDEMGSWVCFVGVGGGGGAGRCVGGGSCLIIIVSHFFPAQTGYDFQLLNATTSALSSSIPSSPLLRTARRHHHRHRRLAAPLPAAAAPDAGFLPHAWAHAAPGGGLSPAPEEGEVKNGDMFGVLRMDGLDPMLAWGMGATTGHVVTALWVEGELVIVESQVRDGRTDGRGVGCGRPLF